MKNFKKYKNKIIGLLFIVFSVLIIGWSLEEEPERVEEEKIVKVEKNKNNNEKKEIKKIKIDIKGEINSPGVYELTEENNVMDAISLAGGLTNKSDTSNINLSKKLKDEMVIIVYSKQEIVNMKEQEKIICPPCNNACIEENDEISKIDLKEDKKETVGKININTASIEELQKLNGIGQSKAQSIVDYRNKNGEFKDIQEIKNVQGIGEAAFEKIKDNITV